MSGPQAPYCKGFGRKPIRVTKEATLSSRLPGRVWNFARGLCPVCRREVAVSVVTGQVMKHADHRGYYRLVADIWRHLFNELKELSGDGSLEQYLDGSLSFTEEELESATVNVLQLIGNQIDRANTKSGVDDGS